MHYQIKKIAGIDCIFAPMQEGNSCTIDISVKAGSEYEQFSESGISHVLEHMFFKGGKKRSTPQAVAIALDQMGAECNAETGGSITSYYIKCAPQWLQRSLEILSDMMVDAQFAPEELAREQEVIIQELKMYEDNPIAVVHEKWASFFFGDTSYGRPIIGYEETIRGFRSEDLFAYQQSLYTKDNMLITIAGKIEDQDQLEMWIDQLFSLLPEHKTRNKPIFQWQLPSQHEGGYTKGTEQNHTLITMPGYHLSHSQRYAARLLMIAFGGNMSSQLFQEIREKYGLCYYISAEHYSHQEYGIFMIRAGLAKHQSTFAEQKITSLLDILMNQGITEEQLGHTKNYLRGILQMGLETSDQIVHFLSSQRLTTGKILTLEEVMGWYEQVSLEDICKILPSLSSSQRWLFRLE